MSLLFVCSHHSSLRLPASLTVSRYVIGPDASVGYGSVTLKGITKRLMDRLQSVLNAAARLVHNSRKYDRISPLLRDLHWLRVPERIKFRLAVLVFRCRNQTAPNYLARDQQWADTDDPWRRLRSATTQKLLVYLDNHSADN